MGTWTVNSGAWTLAGASGRTFLLAPTGETGLNAKRLHLASCAHGVKAAVLASRDGRNCWEVGPDTTGTGGSIVARKVTRGTPAAPAQSAAHGLTSAVPFLMEVRLIAGVITVYLNNSTTPMLTCDTLGVWASNRHWGLAADTLGTMTPLVLSAERCDLSPVFADSQELLYAVCDGNVWEISGPDGSLGASLVGAGAFNGSGPVALAESDQALYGRDGAHAVVIDPTQADPALKVKPQVLTAGTLPGQTAAGTSRSTIIESIPGRLVEAGDKQDRQNLFASAIGDPLDYDYAQIDQPGRAYSTSTSLPNKIGKPVTALKQATGGVLIVGCEGEIWRFAGDPAVGIPQITPAYVGSGASGKDAIALGDGGSAIVHSPDGLIIIPVGSALVGGSGSGVPLSNMTLSALIQFPRGDANSYTVQVVRDTQRHITHVFITPVSSGPAVHIAYDERVGRFEPGAGGFFPDSYPDAAGPTASCRFRGEVVIGTRHGYVLHFDDAATADYDGSPIQFRVPVRLDLGDTLKDTVLSKLAVTLGAGSGSVTYRVYGGRSAEEAYQGAGRWMLFSGTATPATAGLPVCRTVRAPAIVAELIQDAAGAAAVIDRVEAFAVPKAILTRRVPVITLPGVPCAPPVPAGPPDGGPSGGPGNGASSHDVVPPLWWPEPSAGAGTGWTDPAEFPVGSGHERGGADSGTGGLAGTGGSDGGSGGGHGDHGPLVGVGVGGGIGVDTDTDK